MILRKDDTTDMRHHRRTAPGNARGNYFVARNILNLLFMIGAVVGMALYYLSDHTTGIIVILSSMVFKIAECCLRFFRQ